MEFQRGFLLASEVATRRAERAATLQQKRIAMERGVDAIAPAAFNALRVRGRGSVRYISKACHPPLFKNQANSLLGGLST
jgi:hypothetical protein